MRLDAPTTPALASQEAATRELVAPARAGLSRPAPAFIRAMNLAQQSPPPTPVSARVATQAFAATLASAPPAPAASAPEREAGWNTVVRPGQTLSGIVRDQLAARGMTPPASEVMRMAQEVARANQLGDANLIHPGQKLDLSSLRQWRGPEQAKAPNAGATQPAPTSLAAKPSVQAAPAQTAPFKMATAAPAQVQMLTRGHAATHPVLEKTLDRAVEKGFIPPQERQQVYHKIVQLSVQHRFSPDDFARLTLMESDGMNPKASNNRCHGIIQFCDGPDRGAASAGFGANPRAILGHSVLQQLDMVDKYFEDTGLRGIGPVGLDDLYLTVLTPAARNETRPNVALNIPGPQAAYLHVNRDTRAPITRNSILAGLHWNASERLRGGNEFAQQKPTLQAARLSAYAAQAEDSQLR